MSFGLPIFRGGHTVGRVWDPVGQSSSNIHYTYSVSGFKPDPETIGTRTSAVTVSQQVTHTVCPICRVVELG